MGTRAIAVDTGFVHIIGTGSHYIIDFHPRPLFLSLLVKFDMIGAALRVKHSLRISYIAIS